MQLKSAAKLGVCSDCKTIRMDYIHVAKNIEGIISTYTKVSRSSGEYCTYTPFLESLTAFLFVLSSFGSFVSQIRLVNNP